MANPFSEMGGNLISRLTSFSVWVVISIFFLGFFGWLMWFIRYRRSFDIRVKIISERAEDRDKIIFDKAAILYDRMSKVKYFRIWGLKKDLPIPKFNVLQSSNTGDYLELYRKAEDDIYFLTPSNVDKYRLIKSDGKLYPIASQEHKQVDTDIDYWNTKRKQFNKKMFDADKMWVKLLELAPQILAGVFMIFVIWMFMDNLPPILSSLRELIAELQSLKRADVVTGLIPLLTIKWKKN